MENTENPGSGEEEGEGWPRIKPTESRRGGFEAASLVNSPIFSSILFDWEEEEKN